MDKNDRSLHERGIRQAFKMPSTLVIAGSLGQSCEGGRNAKIVVYLCENSGERTQTGNLRDAYIYGVRHSPNINRRRDLNMAWKPD
jgi:hypothetical protein